MNKTTGIILGLFAVLLIAVISYVSVSVSYQNEEKELRIAAKAKQKLNTAAFDDMWKQVAQAGEVADKYQSDFKDIYSEIMDKRYQNEAIAGNKTSIQNNAMLFNFVKEHNPQFSDEIYNRVVNVISAKRTDFYHRQEELLAIAQEHETLISTFPGTWFLSGVEPIDVTIVTSTKTEEVFKTGKEDDVKVFN